MTRRTKYMRAKISPSFKINGRLRGMGKNTASKITGARGRRVSIPKSADSFKSDSEVRGR